MRICVLLIHAEVTGSFLLRVLWKYRASMQGRFSGDEALRYPTKLKEAGQARFDDPHAPDGGHGHVHLYSQWTVLTSRALYIPRVERCLLAQG